MDCIGPCPTGSIDNWRVVLKPYTLEEQFSWTELPEQQDIETGTGNGTIEALEDDVERLLTEAHQGAGGRARAPDSAAKPTVNMYSRRDPAIATVQGSYRLCGIVESPERADSYLRRAADLGHDRAIALRRFAGRSEAPAERWSRISDQLLREAERNGDRFYLAWQRRVDEMRRANGQQLDQPGCYQAALDGTRTAQGGSGTRR
jgi:hypothetical protein